jgi:hypothetical protein
MTLCNWVVVGAWIWHALGGMSQASDAPVAVLNNACGVDGVLQLPDVSGDFLEDRTGRSGISVLAAVQRICNGSDNV